MNETYEDVAELVLSLHVEDLTRLVDDISKEIKRRSEEDLKEALADLREAAARLGVDPASLLSPATAAKPKPERQKREAVRQKRVAAAPTWAWQHPDDPSLLASARGKPPQWLKDLRDLGRDAVKVSI